VGIFSIADCGEIALGALLAVLVLPLNLIILVEDRFARVVAHA